MILILALFMFPAFAQNSVLINTEDFSFSHPTCLIRFDKTQEFAGKLASNLTNKGFKLHDFIDKDKLNSEDLYLSLSIEREGLFFKDCKLHLRIMQANSAKRISSDKILLESKTIRAIPRVTFSGDERCTRGIDDLFVDIPKCTSGALLKSNNLFD